MLSLSSKRCINGQYKTYGRLLVMIVYHIVESRFTGRIERCEPQRIFQTANYGEEERCGVTILTTVVCDGKYSRAEWRHGRS